MKPAPQFCRFMFLLLMTMFVGMMIGGLARAQSLTDKLGLLIPPGNDLFLWVVGGLLAAGALTIAADFLAGLALLLPPPIGPILAFGIKFIFQRYTKFLAEQLPKLADQAWQAVEAQNANTSMPKPSEAKKEEAISILKQQTKLPDSRLHDLEAALEAAHTRNKAAGLELSR